MITSNSNQQIKHIQLLLDKAKYRRETGLFVIEGIRMFLETPLKQLDKVYVSEEFMKKSNNAERVKKLPHEIIADQVFKKMSGTSTPQGILATVKMPVYDIDELLKKGDAFFLILNSVQDPGNIGTMIRTAEAAGVTAIIMDKGCADIWGPKVVRSTMGSIYRVPFHVTEDLPLLLDKMKQEGVKLMAGHLSGTEYFSQTEYGDKSGILIGNEGNGLAEEISQKADVLVKIPMEGKVESLNAAISAALFMYEIKRSRLK